MTGSAPREWTVGIHRPGSYSYYAQVYRNGVFHSAQHLGTTDPVRAAKKARKFMKQLQKADAILQEV